ncbi:hypothetical protein SAY87_027944 [Trapa incisa]|uniref:Uncharacterized protein n=1 Tax=Trapa incisa TaxID=236973 RepID=A0AAN7QRL6_9MYRT|nr:hypothetical protein SAY87_027944 [Trapa incisa]
MIPCTPSLFSPPTFPHGLGSMASNRPATPAFFSVRIKSMAADRAAVFPPQKRSISASDARISLVFALASQASNLSQRLLATETTKYLFPKRMEGQTLEEALMSGLLYCGNNDAW